MSEETNGGWDENRKLVLRSLVNLEMQVGDTEKASKKRHDTVVKMINGLSETYVSKAEFSPISKAVYGLLTVVLSGVAVAILGLVLKASGGQ